RRPALPSSTSPLATSTRTPSPTPGQGGALFPRRDRKERHRTAGVGRARPSRAPRVALGQLRRGGRAAAPQIGGRSRLGAAPARLKKRGRALGQAPFFAKTGRVGIF